MDVRRQGVRTMLLTTAKVHMRKCGNSADRDVWKGFLAGMIGGLVGSWMMDEYQAARQKVSESWKANDPRNGSRKHQEQSRQSADDGSSQGQDEDATMKMAELLSEKVLHRKLSPDEKKKAGPVVHYGYGALAGGIYGAAAEIVPAVRKGGGTFYATALFVGGDEIAVPTLGLSRPAIAYPLSVHANALASHLVYGLGTELGRRVMRAIL
jgi:putative membrane protein